MVFILAVAVTAVGVWVMFRSEQIRDEIRDNPGSRASDYNDHMISVLVLSAVVPLTWIVLVLLLIVKVACY